MQIYDLIKEAQKPVSQEIAELRGEIALLRGSIEDMSAIILGAVTKEKVNKI